MHVHVLTLCDTAAEATLEAAASLHELHVRTHVGLATVAADGPALAVVHQVGRDLQTGDTSRPTRPYVSSPGPPLTPASLPPYSTSTGSRLSKEYDSNSSSTPSSITSPPPHSCLISSTHPPHCPLVPPQHHGEQGLQSPPRISVIWTLSF